MQFCRPSRRQLAMQKSALFRLADVEQLRYGGDIGAVARQRGLEIVHVRCQGFLHQRRGDGLFADAISLFEHPR
jgi:hypothetical protein